MATSKRLMTVMNGLAYHTDDTTLNTEEKILNAQKAFLSSTANSSKAQEFCQNAFNMASGKDADKLPVESDLTGTTKNGLAYIGVNNAVSQKNYLSQPQISSVAQNFCSNALNMALGKDVSESLVVKFIAGVAPQPIELNINNIKSVTESDDIINVYLKTLPSIDVDNDISTIYTEFPDKFEIKATITSINFTDLTNAEKNTLTSELKSTYTSRLDVDASKISVVLSSGSLLITTTMQKEIEPKEPEPTAEELEPEPAAEEPEPEPEPEPEAEEPEPEPISYNEGITINTSTGEVHLFGNFSGAPQQIRFKFVSSQAVKDFFKTTEVVKDVLVKPGNTNADGDPIEGPYYGEKMNVMTVGLTQATISTSTLYTDLFENNATLIFTFIDGSVDFSKLDLTSIDYGPVTGFTSLNINII